MAQPTKQITLAGKDYPVAKLSVRQLRNVVPKLSELLADLGPIMGAALALVQSKGDTSATLNALSSFSITEKQFDLLVGMLVPTLQRLTPSVTEDDILNSEAGVLELVMTIPIIMEMTGLLEPKKPTTDGDKAGDPPPGEAPPPKD